MAETPTQRLHRASSYRPDVDWEAPPDDPLALTGFTPTDITTLPWFYKRYDESLPRVELPRELPPTRMPAVSVLAGAEVPRGDLDLAQLARLLFLCSGVVRRTR